MTVHGKGGRPRKWRSDADRVRAFRARQRGEEEPPTVSAALDEGDELAVAWEEVRRLGELLEQERATLRSAGRELAAAVRRLKDQETRFGWLRERNDRLEAKLAEWERRQLVHDQTVAELARENSTLRQHVESLTNALPLPAHSEASGPGSSRNRAQRRRAAKESRRRS